MEYIRSSEERERESDRMVKVGGFFVCLLIVAMDIAAGILGIEAELEQNKVRICIYILLQSFNTILFFRVCPQS